MKARRAEWRAGQPALAPARLVFLDETWANTKMTRSHGRCPQGQRLVMAAPHGHWKTTTFVAALRCDGLTAPMALDGARNGDAFVAYVRDRLVTTLRPGDIVVLDNLGSHQRAEAQAAIAAAGAELRFLPPYSPDLNPIEKAISKLKALLRAAGKRTIPELRTLLDELVACFTPDQCRNYFRSCGYGPASPERETP